MKISKYGSIPCMFVLLVLATHSPAAEAPVHEQVSVTVVSTENGANDQTFAYAKESFLRIRETQQFQTTLPLEGNNEITFDLTRVPSWEYLAPDARILIGNEDQTWPYTPRMVAFRGRPIGIHRAEAFLAFTSTTMVGYVLWNGQTYDIGPASPDSVDRVSIRRTIKGRFEGLMDDIPEPPRGTRQFAEPERESEGAGTRSQDPELRLVPGEAG